MIALSIKLPDELAETSRRIAEQIGISRSELIRRALAHEIDSVQAQMERRAMAQGMRLLRREKERLAEAETLDDALSETLPEEREAWWNG